MPEFIKELVDPAFTVVLAIDLQNAYCSEEGSMKRLGHKVVSNAKLVSQVQKFIDIARNKKVSIIFTKMIEDSRYMLENSKLKGIEAVCSPASFDFEYFNISPGFGDLELVKNNYDAFSNEDLEKHLKDMGIKNLILTGVNSDVCVDTTLRSAYTKGYNVVVPKDLVSTIDDKKYRQDSVFELWDMFFAHLVTSDDILKVWNKYY